MSVCPRLGKCKYEEHTEVWDCHYSHYVDGCPLNNSSFRVIDLEDLSNHERSILRRRTRKLAILREARMKGEKEDL